MSPIQNPKCIRTKKVSDAGKWVCLQCIVCNGSVSEMTGTTCIHVVLAGQDIAQFRMLLLFAAQNPVGDKYAEKHAHCADHKMYSGKIEGCLIRRKIGKGAVHDQWSDDRRKTHQARKRALQFSLVTGRNMT